VKKIVKWEGLCRGAGGTWGKSADGRREKKSDFIGKVSQKKKRGLSKTKERAGEGDYAAGGDENDRSFLRENKQNGKTFGITGTKLGP